MSTRGFARVRSAVIVTLLVAALLVPGMSAGARNESEAASVRPHSNIWEDQIVYVLIPHKFYDGDPTNNYTKDRYNLPNPNYEGGFLGGDIAGIRDKMDHLKGLGASTVLLYPMFFNDTKPFFEYLATGYRVKDYQRVDPNFGSNADFSAIVGDFHSTSNGPRINVVLDLPIGMTGLEHPWYADAARYPWHYRPWNPVASENVATTPIHMPYGDVDNSFAMPIVNHTAGMQADAGVYRAIRDDVVFWLVDHFDIDGFRYDSAQNAYATFWKRLMGDLRDHFGAGRPDFMNVAESFIWGKKSWQVWPWEMQNETVENEVGPIMMDGVYDFDLINTIQDVFAKGHSVTKIKASMNAAGRDYEEPGRLVASLDNYEDPTFLSAVTGGASRRKIYLASAFLLTANRVPFIYSGNEYAIDYQAPGELFSPSRDQRYLARFKQLVSIRSRYSAFREGMLEWLDGSDTILSYDRARGGEHFFVVLNNADRPQVVRIALGGRGIHCAGAVNLLDPDDPNIRLRARGTAHESLWARLQPFEPKIVRCLN